MKDNLLEMLLSLFEKTLTQLKEKHASLGEPQSEDGSAETAFPNSKSMMVQTLLQSAHPDSIRVFTADEQLKLSKASYQYLMRMLGLGVLTSDTLELVMGRLHFSDSHFIHIQETKWTIREVLAQDLNAEQLAFLDLVLYHKEDECPLH